MGMRFDLITVDVADPRTAAAELVASEPQFEIELDEDDGRWLVVAEPDGRRFGFQRSDEREVRSRAGSIDDVRDGCVPLAVSDLDTGAAFFGEALGLAGGTLRDDGRFLEREGVPVIELVEAAAVPSNIHLDFVCAPGEFAAEADRLLDLGATRMGPLRTAEWGTSQIFLAPSGGVFCLNAYSDGVSS